MHATGAHVLPWMSVREALHWIGVRLAVYAGAAVTAGTLFLAGAAVYVNVVPAPPIEIAPPPPLPITPPVPVPSPRMTPGGPQFSPAGPDDAYKGLVAGNGDMPVSGIIGLKIYDANKMAVGEVTELVMSRKGQAEGLIIGVGLTWQLKKYVFIPYAAAAFQNKDGVPQSITIPYTLGDLQKLPMKGGYLEERAGPLR